MTEASDPDRKRAEAEALDWIVALQEAPEDRQVRRRFRQWLAAAPANARAWGRERAGLCRDRRDQPGPFRTLGEVA